MHSRFGLALVVGVTMGFTSSAFAGQCGAITQVEGEAQIVRNGQSIPAIIGTPVEKGDLIRSPKGSHVDFSMNGVAGLSAAEGAECEISETENGIMKVGLELGELRANIKKLPAGSSFTVETPTAIATVRGTQFISRVVMNDKNLPDSSFAVRDSIVDVTSKKSGEKFSVEQGQAIDVPSAPEGSGPQIRQASGTEIVRMESSSQITACA